MENCTKTQMGQICATCGNIGFAEQLVTCYECEKSSAHIYCMRDRLLNVPTVWYCEECLGASADHIETEKTSKRQKIVIGTEKSNGILERSPLESSEVTRHVSDHEQQSWARKSVSTILKTKVKSTACANSEALFRQGDGMSSPVSNISNSPSSIHFLYQKKIGPADADVHSSPSKYIKRMSEVGNEKAETPEKAKASGGAFHSNSEFIRTGLPEPNMPALVNQYEELLHCHSPQVSWKGTFEIFDVASHLYKKMRAHLPTAICPKVYESMKKLPETLKFKLSSREDIWPKIFRLEPPTKNDIGLYFFPNELGRPKDKYLRLLERLKSRNLAMVYCMNDVQVLLFTSDELPVGSQRIDAEIYLWGLFRHVKHRKPSCKIKVESPSYNSPMDLRDNYCAEVNVPSRCSFEEVAMEVDMVGGKDVGRIDIPIARPTLPPCLLETNAKCLSYEERPVMKFSSEREAIPIHQEVPCGFSKLGLSSFPEEMSSKHQSGFLESSSKGCTPSDISIQNTCTPHCSLESNSRHLNSVERSAVQLSLEKVATPIIPDVPPGFSKLKPPSFSKEMCPKHQSGCLQSTSKACTTSRIDISIKSTSTPHCSPETSARELNSAERSAVQFSLEHRKSSCKIKVESPSYNSPMDSRDNGCAEVNVPSRCSFKEVAMEVDMVGGKDVGRIGIPIARSTLPPCLLETNAKCLSYEERPVIKFSSEREAIPIHQEVPFGFSKLGPSSFPEEMSSKHQIGFLESSSKGCTPSDISIQNTCTPHCSLESNSRHLNSVERSAVQLSLEKVATRIIPDVPPGFSKLKPPSFSKEMCSKHQSGCLQSTSKACTSSRIDISIKSTSTPHCSPETSARDLDSAERSAVQFSLEKVPSPIPPDVPTAFLKLEPPSFPEQTTARDLNSVERSSVQLSCEKLASPIILDVPPGFSKLKPQIFSEELGSKYQSGSLESTFKDCTHSRDIPEENTYTSDLSPETNARDLNCEERSSVQFSLTKKAKASPILLDVPSCLSKVVPQDDLILWSSEHKNLSLESTSKSCIPSRIKLPIQRTYSSNGSAETNATDLNCVQRPLVKFSVVKLISPIRPEVPKCFLKAKPSGSSELSSSLHRGSFLESTSNACRPSRLHNGCNLSSSMEGVASDPNTPDMQSKHHKEQAPGYQNRSPMHIKSSHSSASAKAKKEVTLFSSPVRDTKLHSGSKNLPSPYAEKVNNLSEQERFFISDKVSEKRGHNNFLERSRCSGNIPQRDVKVHSMNKNIGPKESTEQEFKRGGRDDMVNEGDEGKKETLPQSRISWVQQCKPNPEECMENKRRERDGTLYLTNKKGRCSPLENSQSPLPEARRWAGLVRKSKNAVADELVSKKGIEQIGKENQSKLDSENKTVCSGSALHSSPSNILELPKHGMQGQKRIVSYKLVVDGDTEVEEKMKSQRELDSDAKHSSLVGDLYNNPSTIPELPKDGQRKKIMVSYKPVSDGNREVTEKMKSPREFDSENKTVCSVSALHSSSSNILELPKHGPQEQERIVSYKLVMDGDKEVAEKMKSQRELDSEAKHSCLVVDPYNSSSTIPELPKDGFQRHKRKVSDKLVMDGDTVLVDKMKSHRELDSENKQSSLVAGLYNSPSSNTNVPLVADFYSPSSGNCLSQIPLVADFYSPSSHN